MTEAKLKFSRSKLHAIEVQLAKIASNVKWIRGDLVQADFAQLNALTEALVDNWLM